VKIESCSINNFRNLDEISVELHPQINFLVGENDIGKSNFLDMLEIVTNKRRFDIGDFEDADEPIEVELSIILDEAEQGNFDDLFDPDDSSRINIIAKQETPDDFIRYYHKETDQDISYQKFRCLNFIKYDSLRSPKEEITFYRGRGVGRFLNHLVNKFIEDQDPDDEIPIVSEEALEKVTEYVNEKLHRLRLFKEFMLNVGVEEDLSNLVHSILRMTDSKGFAIDKIGYGVQFSLLITLSIMDHLLKMVNEKLRSQCIFDDDGQNKISLVLGLDEPEIHLHPYMQRSLVKYLTELLENEDEDFLKLIDDIFDVGLINGQAIVVTHSPNILLDDYKHIVRFYRDGDGIQVVSGMEIDLNEQIEKHLLKNLPYVKEAFFSRCVILVEGDSELGAFLIFDKRLSEEGRGNFDRLGISVIQAGSADSIPPLMELLNWFEISCVGIMDSDKYSDYEDEGIDNLYSTREDDFEADIYEAFDIADYVEYIEEADPDNRCFFMRHARELDIEIDCSAEEIFSQFADVDDDDLDSLKKELEDSVIKSLRSNKSIVNGRDLASYVTEVPPAYVSVIDKAVELAKNAG